MKRLLVFGVCAFGLILSAIPAYAAGFSQTIHVDSVQAVVPITCAGPGLTIANATGNGVQHLNVNGTGDWFTTTFEGQGSLVQTAGPRAGIVYQGHIVTWFGVEDNNQNGVQHATFNFDGANAANAADTLAMHAAFDVTTNPDGTITADHFTVSCR
jgi:hypothetical protein